METKSALKLHPSYVLTLYSENKSATVRISCSENLYIWYYSAAQASANVSPVCMLLFQHGNFYNILIV